VTDQTPTPASVLAECLRFFASRDESNAALHCGRVRYSPITFRIAEALTAGAAPTQLAFDVMAHAGRYEEDRGR
jgi:hypothetical protein